MDRETSLECEATMNVLRSFLNDEPEASHVEVAELLKMDVAELRNLATLAFVAHRDIGTVATVKCFVVAQTIVAAYLAVPGKLDWVWRNRSTRFVSCAEMREILGLAVQKTGVVLAEAYRREQDHCKRTWN